MDALPYLRYPSMVSATGIPTLETERLLLRPFDKSDFEAYAALYADPEITRHFGSGPEPWDRPRAWRHLAFQQGCWLLRGFGMWAVELRESGDFLGAIGFSAPEGWPGFELAWTLARRWWGHGYATEGAREAMAYAFYVLAEDRVISLIAPENRASIRVAERIGETLQCRIQHLGREMLCYGIDREVYLTSGFGPLPPGPRPEDPAQPQGEHGSAQDQRQAERRLRQTGEQQ